jgi:hypothetical protein
VIDLDRINTKNKIEKMNEAEAWKEGGEKRS